MGEGGSYETPSTTDTKKRSRLNRMKLLSHCAMCQCFKCQGLSSVFLKNFLILLLSVLKVVFTNRIRWEKLIVTSFRSVKSVHGKPLFFATSYFPSSARAMRLQNAIAADFDLSPCVLVRVSHAPGKYIAKLAILTSWRPHGGSVDRLRNIWPILQLAGETYS